MALKSTGHIIFLSLIAISVVLAMPVERRHVFVARAVAIVATFEAGFGLAAWVLPLPWMAGLEPSRQMTSLLGRVPGRVAGTIGLSPNFLGAIFVLSIPLTAALALRAVDRRSQVLWWSAVVAQLVALALTFTRTSLVIALAILVVMLLVRGHARVLLALGALVLMVAIITPLGGRLIGDANDRAALWSSAVLMTVDHPIGGVGPGRSLEAAQADPGRYRDTLFGHATNNAHNTVLLAGAETGVLGALGALLVNLSLAASAFAVLLLTAGPARLRGGEMASRTADLMAAAALGGLGFLVQGMTNNLFAVRVTSVMAVLVFAAFLIPPSVSIGRVLARVRDAPPDGSTVV
jgi:O-antigen ligase